MIQLTVCGNNGQDAELSKFVVTAFLDIPVPGQTTCYAEVCSETGQPFILNVRDLINIKSCHELYYDARTCKKLLSEYKCTDDVTGRHIQRVGSSILDVTPTTATILEVALPEDVSDGVSSQISFKEQPDQGRSWGTWIVWTQNTVSQIIGNSRTTLQFSVRTTNIKLRHHYIFIVLPPNYDVTAPKCDIGSYKSPMSDAPITNPIHEFELAPPFPVFPEWRQWIYRRVILRNRDDIALEPFQYASLNLKVKSEAILGKLSTTSYFSGLV